MGEETTPVMIDDALKAVVDGAFENGTPFVVAYVDGDGQPHLSFRGTTQVFSSDQLAIWVREPAGGLVSALKNNPRLTLMYRDPATKLSYFFYGRAHVEGDSSIAKAIFDNSPAAERERDPEMRGVAVIVDVEALQGGTPQQRILMQGRS